MRSLRGLWFVSLAALFAASAHASPMSTYGATAYDIAQNGGLTADAEDGTAAYYNPAGLGIGGSSGRSSIQLGYTYAGPSLFINRQFNDPNSPSHQPKAESYIGGSLLVSIGGPIKHIVSIGAMWVLPQDGILNVVGLEPSEPQFLRYQADSRITLASGIGVRPIDALAVGIGMQTFSNFSGFNGFTDNFPTLGNRDIEFKLNTINAAVAGITILPNEHWRIAASYRQELGLNVSYPDTVNVVSSLGFGGLLGVGATGTMLYTPHQISAGALWMPSSRARVGLNFEYDLWSRAPPPVFEVSVTTTGGLAVLPIAATTVTPDLKFHDTLTPSLHGEYALMDGFLTLRGAYSYRPTYAPTTTKGSNIFGTGQPVLGTGGANAENYLDASAHIIGLGLSLLWHDPIHLFPYGLYFDFGGQAQILPTSTFDRPASTPSDPVGNISWGGVVIAGAVALRMQL